MNFNTVLPASGPPPVAPRSMLFVSGEQETRFAKAMASGADVVCIDLEDAVAPARKEAARRSVLAWLATDGRDAGAAIGTTPTPPRPGLALRLNGVRTLDGLRDVLALAASGVRVDWLLLPKVESAGDVQSVQAWLGPQAGAIVALLETPRAIEQAALIADAGGSLAALMLGGADLSAELDAQFGWDALLYARGRLVNAAKARGLQAWDVPHIDLQDLDGLAAETRRVIGLGFGCKTAIHPQQLPTIHAAFAPAADELAWAEALLAALAADAASDAAGNGSAAAGAFIFRGRMVDAPVLRRARRIAAWASPR